MDRVDRMRKETARFLRRVARRIHDPREHQFRQLTCNLCGFHGWFWPYGLYYLRPDALCGGCKSLERHRLYKLMLDTRGGIEPTDDVLHFAPEAQLVSVLRARAGSYATSDFMNEVAADHAFDIEAIDRPDESWDVVIANHVLEHVDDAKALPEIFRVLRKGGRALLTVPIVEGLETTYSNPEITSRHGRHLHFQQRDHVKLYGRDFRDRIRAAGFELEEFAASVADCVTYGLVPGERIFIAHKTVQSPATESEHRS